MYIDYSTVKINANFINLLFRLIKTKIIIRNFEFHENHQLAAVLENGQNKYLNTSKYTDMRMDVWFTGVLIDQEIDQNCAHTQCR